MTTVTGYTADKMDEIADATIVGAHITGDDLILETSGGSEVNAGDVRGPQGDEGPEGSVASCLAYVFFGEVDRSSVGNFTSIAFVLAEDRIVAIDYLFSAVKFTNNGNVDIEMTVTGETNRRLCHKAGMVVGDTLGGNGTAVSGRQIYELVAGSYTVAIRVTTISDGSIRSDANWNNQLSAQDVGPL